MPGDRTPNSSSIRFDITGCKSPKVKFSRGLHGVQEAAILNPLAPTKYLLQTACVLPYTT